MQRCHVERSGNESIDYSVQYKKPTCKTMAEGQGEPGPGSNSHPTEQPNISADMLGLLMGQSKSHAEALLEFKDIENPEEGKNKLFLICDHCKCKVMRPGYGTLADKEIFMPHMTEKYKIGTEPVGDTLTKFWLVEDMFHFENVGFSKTVNETVKYLICADCEIGPIGWHDLRSKNELYVAAERVKYAAT